jgi:hypothetical protein
MLKHILVAVHDGITAGIIVDEIHEIALLAPTRFTDRSSFSNSAGIWLRRLPSAAIR